MTSTVTWNLTSTCPDVSDNCRDSSWASHSSLPKPDGEPDEEALWYFESAWFKQLLRHALQARYWGHSLIELGDVIRREDGMMTFDGVELIPRKHVIPEYGRVTRDAGQSWETGIAYREAPYSDWLIEVGARDDLGLYLKAATQTIPKKYAMAFWDAFAEMFGLPIRIAKTASRDQKDIDQMGKMMENMGYKAWAVLPTDSEIELKESSRGDAFNVYDRRIERANSPKKCATVAHLYAMLAHFYATIAHFFAKVRDCRQLCSRTTMHAS